MIANSLLVVNEITADYDGKEREREREAAFMNGKPYHNIYILGVTGNTRLFFGNYGEIL